MTFSFRPATRDRIGLLFGLAGASGSGKTYSAMLLGQGIANGSGKMYCIDTEAGRAKHYANIFQFMHGDFEPPFEPKRYVEAVRAAEADGATVTVIDSMSHEWSGEGGCSDMQAREAERMATDREGNVNLWKIEAMTAPAWKRPKIEHKRMMARLLQSRSHLIFCLRAEEKVKFIKEKNDKGRETTVIVPVGFQPICEKGFMFETSGFITLHPESPGIVRYDMPHKLNDDLRDIFPDGKPITRESGARLRQWAESGADNRMDAAEARIATGVRELIERIEDCSGAAAVELVIGDPAIVSQRNWVKTNRPHLSAGLERVISDALFSTGGAAASDDQASETEKAETY